MGEGGMNLYGIDEISVSDLLWGVTDPRLASSTIRILKKRKIDFIFGTL